MDVADAVEVLTGVRSPRYELEREFAVIAFSGWLNWPKVPYAPANLVFLALNHAVAAEQDKAGNPNVPWLLQALEPKAYIAQLGVSNGGLYTPLFEEVAGEWGYDETRYIADIVRFLLSYKPPSCQSARNVGSDSLSLHGRALMTPFLRGERRHGPTLQSCSLPATRSHR